MQNLFHFTKAGWIAIFLLFFAVSPAAQAKKIRVGIVLDKGGKDDKSFNAAAYKGAKEAAKKFGVHIKDVTASSDAAIEPSLRTFAQRRYDLVIGVGFAAGSPIAKVAKDFKKTKFLLVDSTVDAPNVKSVVFEEHQGSYLVGVIAALTSKSNTIGFIGGMDIPLIRRFEYGYRAGAKQINPKIKVLVNYVGSTSNAWKDPTTGKELALNQYNKKADIIFLAAGASALGAFDAAEEKKKFAIGVDSNQNWIKPGRILTSMVKRLDLAVYRTIEEVTNGNFKAGSFRWGIPEGGIDFSVDEHNRAILSAKAEKTANEYKKKIVNKEINVPDYYEIQKSKKNTGK